jgi:hypothetical protein
VKHSNATLSVVTLGKFSHAGYIIFDNVDNTYFVLLSKLYCTYMVVYVFWRF